MSLKNCSDCGHVVISKNSNRSSFMSKKLRILVITLIILIIGMQTTALSVSNMNNPKKLSNNKKVQIEQNNKKAFKFQNGLYIEEKILDGKVSSETIERASEIIKSRLNGLGISKAKVYKKSNNIIAVEVRGIFDKEKVLQEIETTGKLSFVGPNNDIILTGSDVKDAKISVGSNSIEQIIQLKLTEAGTKKFASATKKYLGKHIAIYMDQTMYSNPTVQNEITGGEVQITGIADINDAKRFVSITKSGSLPVNLKDVVFKIIK